MIDSPTFIDMQYTFEGGQLTPNALLYNDQLSDVVGVMAGYFNKAVPFPPYTSTQVATIGGMAPFVGFANDLTLPVGSVWFNSTLAKLQLKVLQFDPSGPTAGAIENITSTP